MSFKSTMDETPSGSGSQGIDSLGLQVMRTLDDLARFSEEEGALTRRYLTKEHTEAADFVMQMMRDAGMDARMDALGNVIGSAEGDSSSSPRLLIGSHIDTVRDAGRYDGALGIVLPIACLGFLHRQGIRLPYPVDVIAFGDEEGVRFQSTLIGSRAIAGDFDPALLDATDSDGIRLADALRAFGLDPDAFEKARYRAEDVAAYIEVHIEQGPVLEDEGLPVGVVTSIAGATRFQVKVVGQAGHAGTVPMRLRRDALVASAEAIASVERICTSIPSSVGTVGILHTLPGAVNVIPGTVEFSLDVRAESDASRHAALSEIDKAFGEIAERRGVSITKTMTHEGDACQCAPWLMHRLAQAVQAEGISVRELPSGAGHDAMAVARLTDVGMLFVRCLEGISHHPAESMSEADAQVASKVLLRFLESFDPRKTG
ncbi:allantoate amidohydrolase [Thioalkalivibrio sp. HK1]|uniref:allantoate amidohydrolase n=1 Tax=Thioalkalivibrio sp. HK1 TaxID=1469245 RepID=UPI00046FD73F|nr:allantoate amidohydrolase [Thioalkalivibrio sp. HK1]